MSIKSTGTLDKQIGSRMRMQRQLLGISQERLGEMLGITFQQVQKYEKGTNRVSASRLHDIADVLSVDLPFFFQEAPKGRGRRGTTEAAHITEFLTSRDGFELVKAFLAIPDQGMRRAIVDLARAAGNREAANVPSAAPERRRRSAQRASARSS